MKQVRPGRGETIFLDEIGEMPRNLQMKLLRVATEYFAYYTYLQNEKIGNKKDVCRLVYLKRIIEYQWSGN